MLWRDGQRGGPGTRRGSQPKLKHNEVLIAATTGYITSQTINTKRRLAKKLDDVPVQIFNVGSLAFSFIGKVALLGLLTLPATHGGQTSTRPQAIPRSDVVAGSNLDGLIASAEPDWPEWRGPRRDETSDEKDLLPTWPNRGPRLMWKIGNLGQGWSSPIIVRVGCISRAT